MTPHECKTILKTGADSVSFILNALDAIQDYPNILPGCTRPVVGSEAMQGTTEVYNYVKTATAAKTTPGLKPVTRQPNYMEE